MNAEFEFAVFGGIALALFVLRVVAPGAFRAGKQLFVGLAKRRGWAIATVGLLAFLGSVLLSVLFGIPEPNFHDEFSYLLAADTFSSGRLTNPPHPLWVSFETIHVNQQPTYHSMYPPAQGAVLALGQVLTGRPIVGVWLSMAAACGAICWMLQAWLAARWALFGAILATLRLVFAPHPLQSTSLPGYWSHSYWGGAVAALGGALLFGALGRLARRPTAGTSGVGWTLVHSRRCAAWTKVHATTLGLGCAILANSRPFEGLVAALFGFAVLAWRLGDPECVCRRIVLRRIVLPVSAVLGPTAAFILYYNDATTGHPLLMPYERNMAQYSVTPVTLLTELQPEPVYRHEVLRHFYLGLVHRFLRQQSLTGFLDVGADKLQRLWKFFCGPLLSLSLVAMLCTPRSPTSRFAVLGCLTVIWALAHMTWLEPHYLAPVAGLFYLLAAQGARFVTVSRWFRSSIGPVFAPSLLGALVVTTGVTLWESSKTDRSHDWHLQRAAIADGLLRIGTRHLILLRYAAGQWPRKDWVYNAADIDAAPIVWAHESDEQQTRRLLEYYSDRQVWRLRASGTRFELVPFSDPVSRDSRAVE